MFILKNAAKNICRYKNKYIMFGFLYLILILAASICANIFIQMGKVTDNILREYAGVSRLEKFILQEDGWSGKILHCVQDDMTGEQSQSSLLSSGAKPSFRAVILSEAKDPKHEGQQQRVAVARA